MRITYKMDEQELMAFNLHRATRRNAATIPTAAMIACGALAAMLVLGYMMKLSPWTYAVMFGMAVLVFAFIIWFLRSRMKRSVKVMMYRQRKEDLLPQTTISLEDEYFEVYTVSRTSEINYTSVERIEKTKDFICLELDAHGEVGIPLRAFESIEEQDNFLREFIRCTPKAVHAGLGYLKGAKK